MVSKEVVEKIICDFNVAKKEKGKLRKAREGKKLEPKDFEYTGKRKELLEYIKSLEKSDISDICALMAYGRDCIKRGIESDDLKKYLDFRSDFEREDLGFPCYLMKIPDLNKCLRRALRLNVFKEVKDNEENH